MADAETVIVSGMHGIAVCRLNGSWEIERLSALVGEARTVVAREGVILAGTKHGVVRSDDLGQSWRPASEGLAVCHVRWLAYHPDISDREFAGTEPAGIFVSGDGAGSWRGRPEVAELRDRHRWFLPYSPEAGCVRGFAFHGDRMYAAVEVGGVLRSDDGGETWRLAGGSTGEPTFDIPVEPWCHADVHSVYSHASSRDLVYAATAEGLYRSDDGGDSWRAGHAGSYCRAAWIDPDDPDHVVLGPADSVARKNGRIERSRDGGRTWSPASDGLDLPWPDSMVERFAQVGNRLFAVTSDGLLYVAELPDLRWQRTLDSLDRVSAVTAIA